MTPRWKSTVDAICCPSLRTINRSPQLSTYINCYIVKEMNCSLLVKGTTIQFRCSDSRRQGAEQSVLLQHNFQPFASLVTLRPTLAIYVLVHHGIQLIYFKKTKTGSVLGRTAYCTFIHHGAHKKKCLQKFFYCL
jgi:hypothetical protein